LKKLKYFFNNVIISKKMQNLGVINAFVGVKKYI